MCHFKHKKGGIQMLSYETVEPRTFCDGEPVKKKVYDYANQ